LASEVSTSTVSTTSIPPTGKTEEAQIAINGTVSVLKNDQGEVEAIAIVDGTGIETLIVGKEDVSKLLLLDQRRVRMTGYLKIVEVAAPVKRDSAGNKVPISQVEQRRLSPETIVDIGLVPLRVLTGVTIVGEKGP
jgi:hypothetical protein